MDFKEHMNVEEHSHEGCGITISRSDKVERYFITVTDSVPIDSYGIEWKTESSCIMVTREEFLKLIELMNKSLVKIETL